LSTQQNEEKQTAGLSFVVQAQDWPFVSLRGGVANAGSETVGGPVGIELGQIKIPGSSGSLSAETTNWAHNEMTFGAGASALKLWVSRLSPAILIQTSSNTPRLFTGTSPKYVAYPTTGGVQVQTLSTSDTSLSSLNQNWLLLWYAGNSHFEDTKWPLSYKWSVPASAGYQADRPILLVFENQPASIKHTSEGGVDVSFSGPSGYVSLLPLFGREQVRASETEGWSQGLPGLVTQKAQWWADHLCAYPVSVTETYGYDQGTDTVRITESIDFINACPGGTILAPIPPMLAIAKDALRVTFSGSVVDGNLPTEFGPSLGIENPPAGEAGTQSYTWSVSGLRKYTDSKRIITDTGQAPAGLEQELESEVQKIINSGHLAPWIFLDYLIYEHRGDLYWDNPADIIYHLSEVAEALPDGAVKAGLVDYIKSERSAYPPEDVYRTDIFEGTLREDFSYYGGDVDYYWQMGTADDCRQDARLKRVPLYSFYALSQYYDLTGESLPSDLFGKAKDALDKDMREQDWATFYWFKGFEDFYAHPEAVANANRHFAGLVGYVRLAKKEGDTQAEHLGRTLLAKAAVLRLGLAKYPRYLYAAGLIELGAEPDWQPNNVQQYGFLYNFHWTGPYDDARQVGAMNQFQVNLQDHSGSNLHNPLEWDVRDFHTMLSPYLITFRDMVPELGRLLADYARDDVQVPIDKVEAFYPHWYAAFGEAVLGAEHNLWHPINGFQTFMAKALIQQESPGKLARYADISWLEAGDLFYVHKLAETIKAYRGVTWDDGDLPGDVNCDCAVDIVDIMLVAGHWNTSVGDDDYSPAYDLDGDGDIDIADIMLVAVHWGETCTG